MSEQEQQTVREIFRDGMKTTDPAQQELILAFSAGMAAQARLEAQKREKEESGNAQ